MKQLKAKLLAGVLTAAMVLGTFAGAAPLTAKAASHATELAVRAVDESGKALSGVELVFEKDGETYDFATTDEDGEAYLDENDFTDLVMANMDAADGDGTGFGIYEVKPASGSGYTLANDSIKMDVQNSGESWGYPCIVSVNGKAYAGETVDLALKVIESEKPVEPVEHPKTLNVKVVNEKGLPVEGVHLEIFSPNCCRNSFAQPTDAVGTASYTLSQREGIGMPFAIALAEGEDYEIVTPIENIYFERDTNQNENYIAKVNGQEYNGEEVKLVVKKNELSISEVSGAGAEVSREGGTATITVKGTSLPAKFYYVVHCYSPKGVLLSQVEEKEAEAKGTETLRTFEAEFPSVLHLPKAAYWEIGVETIPNSEDGYYMAKGENGVKIAGTVVTEESKNTMVEIFTEAGKKNESDYTAESWNVYKNAVEAAKKIAEDNSATNAEFQNAIQAVKDAEAALVKTEPEKPSNPEKPAKPEVKVASVKLAKTSYVYDGKVKKPGIVAKNDKGEKITSKDYTVKYAAGCKNVGTYTVKVTFKGDYKGTFTKTFKINPKGTSLSKVKAARKSFSATWKKQSKQTSGYQLQYSTNKKFAKSVKTTTITKTSTVKKTVKKLSAKKTYYVRVRTYKNVKVGKKTVKMYSGWSKVKSVKVK
ncbi:hypothetical protein DXC04_07755 [Dorea sp. OM07-5]|uniref:FIVAR domain-containing protein n=1 Tax=Dorea sp. OM07-5 TaxID=2293100 RepID=UPI000E54E916|nr:FIVAR domain-containing protein [Dorea sp. OM07-5]RHU96375.1 hypothetical protein DXC04_07755 [Dorea sp. OM07-5]